MTSQSSGELIHENSRTADFASIEGGVAYLLTTITIPALGQWRVLGHARHSENEQNYLVIHNPNVGPAFLIRTADRALDIDNLTDWNFPQSERELVGGKYNIRLGRYRHYKGGIYLVLGTAVDVDDENGEPLVIYVPLYTHPGHAIAIRPKSMFEDTVEVESGWPKETTDEFPNMDQPSRQPRFSFIPY